jgi:hypothetical protein
LAAVEQHGAGSALMRVRLRSSVVLLSTYRPGWAGKTVAEV